MRVYLLVFFFSLVSPLALACPNLSGEYSCKFVDVGSGELAQDNKVSASEGKISSAESKQDSSESKSNSMDSKASRLEEINPENLFKNYRMTMMILGGDSDNPLSARDDITLYKSIHAFDYAYGDYEDTLEATVYFAVSPEEIHYSDFFNHAKDLNEIIAGNKLSLTECRANVVTFTDTGETVSKLQNGDLEIINTDETNKTLKLVCKK